MLRLPDSADDIQDLIHLCQQMIRLVTSERATVTKTPGNRGAGDAHLAGGFNIPDLIANTDRFLCFYASLAQGFAQVGGFTEKTCLAFVK